MLYLLSFSYGPAVPVMPAFAAPPFPFGLDNILAIFMPHIL
jgi:hypothetical protein